MERQSHLVTAHLTCPHFTLWLASWETRTLMLLETWAQALPGHTVGEQPDLSLSIWGLNTP